MNDYNIYVHVGLPKAASTTLQRHLFDKAETLLNMGVLPINNIGSDTDVESFDSIYLKDPKVRKFYTQLVNDDDLTYSFSDASELLDELLGRYVSDKETKVVFSDEKLTSTFYSHPDIGLKAKRLKNVLPDAKVIIVIREQTSWIVSQYRDHPFDPRELDIGRPVSIEKWIDIALWSAEVRLFSMLAYNELVGLYEELFGEDNVCVLLFEDLVNDLPLFSNKLSDFLGVNSKETLRLLENMHENTGVSSLFNGYRGFKRKYLTFGRLAKIYDISIKEFIEKTVDGGKKQKIDISPQHVSKLREKFSTGNSLLNNRCNLGMEKYHYKLVDESLP